MRSNDAGHVDALLRAGADANAATRYGVTPLYLACVNGDAKIALARMLEHAIRVTSEAATAGIPQLIADWTQEHPAVARRDASDLIAGGTEKLVAGYGGDA